MSPCSAHISCLHDEISRELMFKCQIPLLCVWIPPVWVQERQLVRRTKGGQGTARRHYGVSCKRIRQLGRRWKRSIEGEERRCHDALVYNEERGGVVEYSICSS